MSQWESRFTKKALAALSGDEAWRERVQQVLSGTGPRVHLAIFVEPFLDFVLSGKKTVESRFSVNRCPPYEHVSRGDIVLLKRASGPVVGACIVSAVWSYRLDRGSWAEIRR